MINKTYIVDTLQLGREFKQWVARLKPENYPTAELEWLILLRFWVGRMSTRQAGQLAIEIAELSSLTGFDMTWFRSFLGKLQPNSHFARMLTYFGLAAYLRWDSRHHQKILSWLKSPDFTENQDFAWQLYLRLVEAGFTDFPGEFLMDSQERRRAIIMDTIQAAYFQDYSLLAALTREIIFLQQSGINLQARTNPVIGQLHLVGN